MRHGPQPNQEQVITTPALKLAAAPAPVAQGAHVELLKESAELFRFYEQSHRARGPEHLTKAERNAEIAGRIEAALAAPAPVALTPAQQHADELLQALTHLHHNARASGAEMGLALDVAGALLAKVKATGQESGA